MAKRAQQPSPDAEQRGELPAGSRWPAHKVESWPIGQLKPYANNTKKHSPAQIEQLRASFREFGWTIPVLAREDGTLIAGHGRIVAGIAEGFTEVPVIVARGWTEDQCRAYGIADNRLTETGEWDEKLLKLELGELLSVGFDPHLTGFDGDDLDKLMLPDDGAGKKPRKAQGDLSPVIQFNIVFDNEQQQEAWFAFVRQLKGKYPDEETLGARLERHLQEPASAAG
jgi:ParB-like chromosome segregation protein Spo0J